MSDEIWCSITAKFPNSWWPNRDVTPRFIELLDDAFYNGDAWCDDCGDAAFTYHVDGVAYTLDDTDARAALDWLYRHRVPYEAHQEAKYEYSGRVLKFDGQFMSWEGSTTGDQACLTREEFDEMGKSYHGGVPSIHDIVEHFKRFEWDVSAADISHLPTESPEEVSHE